MAPHDLLAGLVAYRVIYFLTPLLAAAVMYLIMEAKTKKTGSGPN